MLRAGRHVLKFCVRPFSALSAMNTERNFLFRVRGIDDLRSSVWNACSACGNREAEGVL